MRSVGKLSAVVRDHLKFPPTVQNNNDDKNYIIISHILTILIGFHQSDLYYRSDLS